LLPLRTDKQGLARRDGDVLPPRNRVAGGGTPASPERAGRLGLPMTLAINSRGYVVATSQQASDEFFPPYEEAMTAIGRERGWPAMTRDAFETMREPDGALFVGMKAIELFGTEVAPAVRRALAE
jgi:hypothetical protein